VSGIEAPGLTALGDQHFSDDQVRGLEAIAATAWPAAERQPLDGWLLRASPAPTRRVNSVLANAVETAMSLEARIDAVEDYYRRRRQPPRFQLTRGSCPNGLDAALADRGYEIEAPVDVQIAAAAALETTTGLDGTAMVRVTDTLTPDWMEVYSGGFNRDVTSVIEQISAPAAFLTLQDADGAQDGAQDGALGDALGVALGVLAEGWLGIFGMQTRVERRNQGFGRAMLAGLAAWALEEGAVGVYLQVEQDNPDARRLYERQGFRTVYTYHYRTLFSS